MLQATPLTLLPYSHCVSALSQQGTRAVMTPGPTDWLSHLWQRPHSGNGLSFSECVSCGEQEGALNKGSFSLTNIVTQLPVKWVTSCTQTVPLLSTSVPLQGDAIMSQVLLLYNCSLYSHWVIVNKQLIICSSPSSLLSFISKKFGSSVAAEMDKRNGIWVPLPGVKDAVCTGEIKYLCWRDQQHRNSMWSPAPTTAISLSN